MTCVLESFGIKGETFHPIIWDGWIVLHPKVHSTTYPSTNRSTFRHLMFIYNTKVDHVRIRLSCNETTLLPRRGSVRPYYKGLFCDGMDPQGVCNRDPWNSFVVFCTLLYNVATELSYCYIVRWIKTITVEPYSLSPIESLPVPVRDVSFLPQVLWTQIKSYPTGVKTVGSGDEAGVDENYLRDVCERGHRHFVSRRRMYSYLDQRLDYLRRWCYRGRKKQMK